MNKKELWLRLVNYHFDHIVPPNLQDRIVSHFGGLDSSTQAFAAKISRKLEWKTQFSIRAIKEYKKFLYLGVIAGFSVTPPKILDQVWHEHILFTKAYREFCSEILERPFDHNPELMASPNQTVVYESQYSATLELYHKEFGYDAPSKYWGTPKFANSVQGGQRDWQQPPSLPLGSGYYDYTSDPPLMLWIDSELSGTFSFDAGDGHDGFGDSSGGDSSSDGSSSDGGGCSSGCGSGCGGG